jgi:hypothetical protein
MKTDSPIFSQSTIMITACLAIITFGLSIARTSAQALATPDTEPRIQEIVPTDDEAKPKTEESADPPPAPIAVKVAGGEIQFSATGNWSAVPPKSRMLEAELKIPAVEGDEQNGRLTIMGAGGSVAANIDRWKSQFVAPAGSRPDEHAKTEELTIAEQTVTLVDISGNFLDAPGGPFSGKPKVERKNYRMLAAIIQTKAHGNYFVKFYGPAATIKKNKAAFQSMIESLQVAD